MIFSLNEKTRVRWTAERAAIIIAAVVVFASLSNSAAFGQERAEASSKWSAQVKLLAEPQPAQDRPAEMAEPAPPLTNSAGLPPQYQTTRRVRESSADASDASVRFVVPLIEQPVLVEARITFDGRPFRQAREERIERLLKKVAEEPTSEPSPSERANGAPSGPQPAESTSPEQPNAENAAEKPATVDPEELLVARLRRFESATQRPLTHDEVRWFVTNWVAGQSLLLLDENYQRVRAHASPLFSVLDRDEDGILSAAEIENAQTSLRKYDNNQDEILSLPEITKGAERTPVDPSGTPATPPRLLLEQLTDARTFQQLAEQYNSALTRFDPDSDGRVSESELSELKKAQPDLTAAINFDTQQPARSRLEITHHAASAGEAKVVTRNESVTLLIGGTWLEFSAVQSSRSGVDQISLGAVRDGFPLLPEMDANEDGTLTIRELRQLSTRLKKFDRDGDGAVARSELLPTMRVAFGFGPVVHRSLFAVRSAHQVTPTVTQAPPEWFARMDRNKDGDLTPREFLGGKEQFAALDTDKDELISIAEASVVKE